MAPGIAPNKLTFSFTEAATFRHDGKKIDLAKATDTLVVKDKDGNDKTIKGFQSANGTFFHLKTGADGKQKIQVYGTPEQLAASNLQVRNGDITRARFGDERFVAKDPFKARSFEMSPEAFADHDKFAASYNLRMQASLNVGGSGKPGETDLTDQLLKDGIDRKATERRMSERLVRKPDDDLLAGADAKSLSRRSSVGGRDHFAVHRSGSLDTDSTVAETQSDGVSADRGSRRASLSSERTETDLSIFSDLNDAPPALPDETPITAENKQQLADQPGLRSFFGPPDAATADLRERLTKLLAARTGFPAPPGSTPLDFLNDGTVTVGQLKATIDSMSLNMGIQEPAGQRPADVLAQFGRTPVETLDDGNCLFAALAHSFGKGDSMDQAAALSLRRELRDAFEVAKRYPAQLQTIAGGKTDAAVAFVEGVLGQGLDGGAVSPDGWGGPESLKLAAMQNKRPIVTITSEGTQIFDAQGGMERFTPDQLDQLKSRYASLDNPVVLTLERFHWQATEASV